MVFHLTCSLAAMRISGSSRSICFSWRRKSSCSFSSHFSGQKPNRYRIDMTLIIATTSGPLIHFGSNAVIRCCGHGQLCRSTLQKHCACFHLSRRKTGGKAIREASQEQRNGVNGRSHVHFRSCKDIRPTAIMNSQRRNYGDLQ